MIKNAHHMILKESCPQTATKNVVVTKLKNQLLKTDRELLT